MDILQALNKLAQQGLFEIFACSDEKEFREGLRGFADQMIAMGEEGKPLGLAFSAGAHSLAVMSVIRKFTSHKEWLADLANGNSIGAIAIAEPEGGSDAFSLKTVACRTPDGYILSGAKHCITNATVCNLAIVFAHDVEQDKIVCVAVTRDNPGFKTRGRTDLVGLEGSGVGDIELIECIVPEQHVIGVGQRAKWAFMLAMEWERGMILAPTIGCMRQQLRDCAVWLESRKRRQEKSSLIEVQAVRHRLVQMQLRLQHSELLFDNFVTLKSNGKSGFVEASAVKIVLSENFVANSLDAIALYGSWGYSKDCPAQAHLRDAMGFLAASGPNDVQRDIVGNFVVKASCH